MTKKQKPKAEPKAKAQTRSRALVPRSEHPAKAVMRELLAARQEDRAARQVMAEQIAELKALVIAGRLPVLPTSINDYTKMLNCRQFCEVLGGVDENRFYNRTDTKTIGGTKLVDGDAVRLDYPDRFNESLYQQIRAKAAEPRKRYSGFWGVGIAAQRVFMAGFGWWFRGVWSRKWCWGRGQENVVIWVREFGCLLAPFILRATPVSNEL